MKQIVVFIAVAAIAAARPAFQILDMVDHLAAMFAPMRAFFAPSHIVQGAFFEAQIFSGLGCRKIRTFERLRHGFDPHTLQSNDAGCANLWEIQTELRGILKARKRNVGFS